MIRTLEQSHDHIYGFSVSGDVSGEEYQQMASEMRDGIAKHGTIRLLFRIDDIAPKSFLTGLKERIDFTADHADDIERIALVTDSKAADLFSAMSGLVSAIEVDSFDRDEEEKAWAWLS